MDWAQQQGVSFPQPRSECQPPRMQYQHAGSRMLPFARGGGAYSRGQKQFYPPPPSPLPPPLPAAALPLPPQNKYEVLMEAGRLAAEYLVAKGVLPPGSLQQRGGAVAAGGWGQLPPPPPAPLSVTQEAPTYYSASNGRRQVEDERSIRNARSRRNRGGDYSNSNSSYYNGRGKRKFGADNNRYSDWTKDRGRSRRYSDIQSYDDDDDDGAPGFKRERGSGGGIDEVGSSVSGVAGGPSSKVEAMGESELEDTGSKVSSNSNVQQKDASQEVEDENGANKMQENSVVSNSVVVEQALNGEDNSNNGSSDGVQEAETKQLPVSSGEKVSDGRPEDSGILNDKVEDDSALLEKAEDDTTSEEVSVIENNLPNDATNLLNYCSFARVPTRPRSVLANRNVGPAQREIAVSKQVNHVTAEEMSQVAMDGEANTNSVNSVEEDSKELVGQDQEHTEQSTIYNQVPESVTFHEKETHVETEEMEEQKNIPQHYEVEDNKEMNELSPTFGSSQNNFNLQVEKGIQIYNLDTPPQDEVLIDPPDKGKTVDSELLPNIKAEDVTMEEEKLGQSSSFKIRDLNLVGSPEVADMRGDPRLGQSSTAGCSVDLQDNRQVDFGTALGNNASNTDTCAPLLLENKAVQVIDIEDDSPIEAGACDTSKSKGEMVYSSMEGMMNPPTNTDALHGIQDGYGLGISDYLGADMSCYQSIQTELQLGMDLNGSEGITVMDDPIYSSLSDIGFMEVWDQQPPDYEKFF